MARDHLTHHRTHGPADERRLHCADQHGFAIQLAIGRNESVPYPGGCVHLLQSLVVGLLVHKLQRVV